MKLCPKGKELGEPLVAPRAGAWIETYAPLPRMRSYRSRPPRGGVD